MIIHDEIHPKNFGIVRFEILKELNAGFNFGKGKILNVSMKFNPKGIEDTNQNIKQLLNDEGINDLSNLVIMSMNHTDIIKNLDSDSGELFEVPNQIGKYIECDACITSNTDEVLFANPADCAVLVGFGESKEKKYTFLIHSGRKGQTLNIISKTISELVKLGVDLKTIKIGITPALSGENHKIQKWESDEQFAAWKNYHKTDGEIIILDTYKLLLDQLQSSGILEENIELYEIDTFAEAQKENIFSHRYATTTETQNGRYTVFTQLK